MGYINYCLMCLGTGVKMYHMNSKMIKMYHELIFTPPKRNLKHMCACYECAYLLYKHQEFKTRCCKAYNILCNLSPESFQITEESLNSINYKQNKLRTVLSSCIFTDDYQPNQQEWESDEEFEIGKVKTDPINETKVANNEDPLEIETKNIQIQTAEVDVKNAPECYIENALGQNINDDQNTDVKSTPELDIETDYQFIDKFKVESCNYNKYTSNTGSMLWLTIESKENIEVCNENDLGGSVQLHQDCYDSDDGLTLNNYSVKDNKKSWKREFEIPIESDINEFNEPNKITIINDDDDKDMSREVSKKTKKRNCSRKEWSGCLSLKSNLFKEHMTVVEMTLEEARKEFLLRKKSSNYTSNPFKCTLCYRGFISKTSYESHARKHSLEYGTLQCEVCKLSFIDKAHLGKHRVRMHKRKFTCKLCPYVCFAPSQCNAHIQSHRGKVFSCKKCDRTYRFRNSLLTHMHLKHSVECVCEFCGSTFASKHGLFGHKHLVHRQEVNEYLGPKCEECEVHFASELAWKRHRVLCSRHEVPFGCKVCGDVLEDADALRTHARDHSTFRREYWSRKKYCRKTCSFCKIGLPNNKALKSHLMNEHPSEVTNEMLESLDDNYVCEFCGKSVSCRAALVSHQRQHADEAPYSCPECPMRTKYKENLALHRRVHEPHEPRGCYTCDLCGRPFSEKHCLTRHIKYHMGIRPFKCVACDKTFMFRCDERNHYKHVHDKMPYPKKNKNAKTRRRTTYSKIKTFGNV